MFLSPALSDGGRGDTVSGATALLFDPPHPEKAASNKPMVTILFISNSYVALLEFFDHATVGDAVGSQPDFSIQIRGYRANGSISQSKVGNACVITRKLIPVIFP